MTRPPVFLLRMIGFLAAVLVVGGLLAGQLLDAFIANPLLNLLILTVLVLGIGWNLRQVMRLTPEVNWLEAFQRNRASLAALPTPRLLAPMVHAGNARHPGRWRGADHHLDAGDALDARHHRLTPR